MGGANFFFLLYFWLDLGFRGLALVVLVVDFSWRTWVGGGVVDVVLGMVSASGALPVKR